MSNTLLWCLVGSWVFIVMIGGTVSYELDNNPEVRDDWRLYWVERRMARLHRILVNHIRDVDAYLEWRARMMEMGRRVRLAAVVLDSLSDLQQQAAARIVTEARAMQVTLAVQVGQAEEEYDPEVFWTPAPALIGVEPMYGELEEDDELDSTGATLDDLIGRNDAVEEEMREIDRKARGGEAKLGDVDLEEGYYLIRTEQGDYYSWRRGEVDESEPLDVAPDG